jgi:hypothetical protein
MAKETLAVAPKLLFCKQWSNWSNPIWRDKFGVGMQV